MRVQNAKIKIRFTDEDDYQENKNAYPDFGFTETKKMLRKNGNVDVLYTMSRGEYEEYIRRNTK